MKTCDHSVGRNCELHAAAAATAAAVAGKGAAAALGASCISTHGKGAPNAATAAVATCCGLKQA